MTRTRRSSQCSRSTSDDQRRTSHKGATVGRVTDKVAFITGAARGQGRSHAVHLAAEGADIVAVDACSDLGTVPYQLATDSDLAETARQVEALDRRCLTIKADVRKLADMEKAARQAVAQLGQLDIVVANAGILTFGRTWEMSEDMWTEMMSVNLDGAWKTVRATVPHMVDSGRGGSVILVSSTNGKRGYANMSHYTATKHGVVGMCKSLAVEGAEYGIRANTVHPTTCKTHMAMNDATYGVFFPDVDDPSEEQIRDGFQAINMLPVPWIEPSDVSNAVLYLASDESRFVTASQMYVDAGCTEC
ncbi:MAG: mycofactocin-coupled SDR family oxidoreductase [Beutenbergiaceae bacterium]